MSDDSESISRASVKLATAKGLNAVLVFGGTALFARLIGADQLGTYFLFEKLLGLIVVFSNFGLAGALEKRLSEGSEREQYLGAVAAMKVAIVAVLAVVIAAAQAQINDYLDAELAVLLIVALVLRESGRLFFHALRGQQRVGDTSYLLAAKQLAWVGVGGTLAAVGYGSLAPVYGLLVGLAAIMVLAFLLVDIEIGRPSIDHAKSLLHFAKYDFISSSIGWQVYNSLDTLLIGYFLTTVAVSQYEVAWRISTIVMTVTASISAVIFPSFSKFVTEGEEHRIREVVRWSLGAGFLVVLPALVGVMVLGEPILRFLFGPEYVSAWIVLVLLVADKGSQAVQTVCAQVVRAHDRPEISAGITAASILLNAAGNYLLIPRLGLPGAAIATTGSFAVGTVLHLVATRRFITITVPWRVIGWQAACATVMGLTLIQLTRLYPVTSALGLIVYVVVGAAIYGGTIVLHDQTRDIVRRPFAEGG